MAPKIPENVIRFVYEHIDSVEQLEILLFLQTKRDQLWSSQSLSQEFRSNLNSVSTRLLNLKNAGLVQESETQKGYFQFSPKNPDLVKAVGDLTECYRVRKQSILELIFSPLKKGRDFAQAFNVMGSSGKKGEENG